MNFVCSITNTLINEEDKVRVFFIEGNKSVSFPFMNYHAPESTTNFEPLGCSFQAIFAHSDHDEYFTFMMDKEESPVAEHLLDYINKNTISKNEAEELRLISHHSKDISWGSIDSLQELFIRCNTQSVYFKANTISNKNPFVSTMVMHESAYQTILKHGDIQACLNNYNSIKKSKPYIKDKEFVDNFINREREEVEKHRGKMHKWSMEESVLFDQDVFEHMMERISNFKDHDDPELRQHYLDIEKEELEKIGTKQTVVITKERFVDDKYIDNYVKSTIQALYKLNQREFNAFKKATRNLNTDNFIANEQVSKLLIQDKFTEKEWLPIFESILIERFLTDNGCEFLPSRRQYQHHDIRNKAFYKDLIELDVYR